MTAAPLSDNLPFYDDPDECKPCEWCNKPMVRRELERSISYFRKRKACSYVCHQRLRAGIYPGDQWNHLTVLDEGGRRDRDNTWLCKCVCGDVLSVRTVALKKGDSKSCGCGGSIALNQRFGMLKTIKKGKPYTRPIDGFQETNWICECDCGFITTVRAVNLLSGSTTSCGCKSTTRLEDAVERSLNRLNVSYRREHKPEPLVDRGFQYRLDFYLPDHNVNIEADGKAWHGGGNKYESPEEQIAYDNYRNNQIIKALDGYILRLSEKYIDRRAKLFLDNDLRLFLNSTLNPSLKDRPWKRVIYFYT
jgi:very-short-patch-repair endonuclease